MPLVYKLLLLSNLEIQLTQNKPVQYKSKGLSHFVGVGLYGVFISTVVLSTLHTKNLFTHFTLLGATEPSQPGLAQCLVPVACLHYDSSWSVPVSQKSKFWLGSLGLANQCMKMRQNVSHKMKTRTDTHHVQFINRMYIDGAKKNSFLGRFEYLWISILMLEKRNVSATNPAFDSVD